MEVRSLTATITVQEVRIHLNLKDSEDWVEDEVIEAKISWAQYIVDNEISVDATEEKEYWAVLWTAIWNTWQAFSFQVVTAAGDPPPNFIVFTEWLNRHAILARALASGGKKALPDTPMTTVDPGVQTSLKGSDF